MGNVLRTFHIYGYGSTINNSTDSLISYLRSRRYECELGYNDEQRYLYIANYGMYVFNYKNIHNGSGVNINNIPTNNNNDSNRNLSLQTLPPDNFIFESSLTFVSKDKTDSFFQTELSDFIDQTITHSLIDE